ncbi:MAG: hypothetical protein CL678_00920 [Bdellovibrionaceae bacterium]|nr:hypothetical protein [Pseudobdellovibrionaceae bacterium]|tara:strand:+ start:876 stop:1409 length:534 start_codon:yes stop_codon:yes gene_type:complete
MVSEGTAAVVRQLLARGRLSKANVVAVASNSNQKFSWRELRLLALCNRSGVVLRTEHTVMKAIKKCPAGLDLKTLSLQQRVFIRIAKDRLRITIRRGKVLAQQATTIEAFKTFILRHPGTSLLKLVTLNNNAPNHVAALWSKRQITTHGGCVWASPGPDFDQRCSLAWHRFCTRHLK